MIYFKWFKSCKIAYIVYVDFFSRSIFNKEVGYKAAQNFDTHEMNIYQKEFSNQVNFSDV